MNKFFYVALLASAMTVAHAQENIRKANGAVHVSAGQSVGDVAGTNGNVHLEDGAQAKDVATVNGKIEIGRNAIVGDVHSVNGSISLDEGTRAESVKTVNGSLALGERVQVDGDVTAVNGRIQLDRGASTSGTVQTANGSIELDHASVGRDLRTKNGNIEVGAESTVKGGIFVEKDNSGWVDPRRLPRIVIGPNAVVSGPLKFEREVELYVSDTARTGPITGAKAVKFSGAKP